MDNLISLIDKIGMGRIKVKEALEKIKISSQSDTRDNKNEIVSKTKESNTKKSNNFLIEEYLVNKISHKVGVANSEIETTVNFLELGLDSVTLIQMTEEIEEELNVKLYPTLFFEYQTIDDLSEYFNNSFQNELKFYHGAQADNYDSIQEEPGETVNLSEVMHDYLKDKISHKLNISSLHIDSDVNFLELGLDSVTLITLSEEIENHFNIKLYPTLFFEFQNIKELTAYFIDNFTSELSDHFSFCSASNEIMVNSDYQPFSTEVISSLENDNRLMTGYSNISENISHSNKMTDDIAIIGFDGIFPGSPDLETFWKNLENCNDLITEIPSNRWDWKEYYGDPLKDGNKTYAKWGGFIDDIDKFDAKFFNISPREAELMDPQQRIFLQTVWNAIERGGLKVSDLSKISTGLFVGVSTNDYSELMVDNKLDVEAQTSIGTVHSILPNRVSYLLNFNGPSESIDTACSSSLVAIHRALMAIQNGECDVAIAGGVNALLSPKLYISFSKAGMLSKDGRCKTFDKDANGYVRGEGVGAVILKPLSKALQDNDTIYAVVKSSVVNHGGRANSLTAPNPVAQAKLIINAYKKANIDSNTISYIEAHGTGTTLGDPIEITGLKRAFSELNDSNKTILKNKANCALGAVKTNIGHLESAAGIAGVIKILLSMKHKVLPGNVHLQEVNPYIDLADSPFYFIRETKPWDALQDKSGKNIPRVAGISSFGFGGANSHIVLEEFTGSEDKKIFSNIDQVLVLSAKNEKQLSNQVSNLLNFLKDNKEVNIEDVAYTLQVGREIMEERLAVIFKNKELMIETLEKYIQGEKKQNGLFCGNVRDSKEQAELLIDGDEGKEFINKVIQKKKFSKLAKMWVSGIDIDWKLLYGKNKNKKIMLPTYPFAKERFWFSVDKSKSSNINRFDKVLHPLISNNCSTLNEQSFETFFTGSEFFLKDHVVKGKMILPGVSYIEMAYAAYKFSSDDEPLRISNIVWAHPVIQKTSLQQVKIGLYPNNGNVEFEVYSTNDNDEESIHAQGKISFEKIERNETKVDIQVIRDRLSVNKYNKKSSYEMFYNFGLQYGESFQPITELYCSEEEAFSYMELPKVIDKTFNDFYLHPSLMDGALQTAMGVFDDISSPDPYLPFSLGDVIVYSKLTEKCYAHVVPVSNTKNSSVKKFDIKIIDEEGNILIFLKNFTTRQFKQKQEQLDTNIHEEKGARIPAKINSINTDNNVQKNSSLMYFDVNWNETKLEKQNGTIPGITLVFDSEEKLVNNLIKIYGLDKSSIILVKSGSLYEKVNDSLYIIDIEEKGDYQKLFNELKITNRLPGNIVHNYCNEQFSAVSADIHNHLQKSIYSLLHISQNMLKQKITNNLKLVFLYSRNKGEIQPIYAGVSGFAKTIKQENPKFTYRVIEIVKDNIEDASRTLAYVVNQELLYDSPICEIRYENNKRYEKIFSEVFTDNSIKDKPVFKDGGLYLITGGFGGLGSIFAHHIAKKVKGTIVLTGRSELDDVKQGKIKEIEKLGSDVVYIKGDISDRADVFALVEDIKNRFSRLDGIIHSAGILRDSFIALKSSEDMEKVLSSKVYGTCYLDEATKNEKLDFFIMFSSIAAAIGNSGQCDYSYANSFLDYYSEMRNQLDDRNGISLTINWPLWKNGGMHVDAETEKWLEKKLGMLTLKTTDGIGSFDFSMLSGKNQILVIDGHRDIIGKLDNIQLNENPVVDVNKAKNFIDINKSKKNSLSESNILDDIKSLFSELLKVNESDIDIDSEVAEYGVDSIMMMTIMNRIEDMYGETVEPNSLSEHPTIRSFVQYLIDENIAFCKHDIEIKIADKTDSEDIRIDGYNFEVVVKELRTLFSELLKVNESDIDIDSEVAEYGVDSIMMMTIMNRIEDMYGETVEPNSLTEHPTINLFARYLIDENIVSVSKDNLTNEFNELSKIENDVLGQNKIIKDREKKVSASPKNRRRGKQRFLGNMVADNSEFRNSKIAIIGTACRFPGSETTEHFWENLKQEKTLIKEVPENRWSLDDFYSPEKNSPLKSYSKWGGFLNRIDMFDAGYFGITDDEALILDPQHRLLLEITQELFDHAGYTKEEMNSTNTGVFIGASESSYVKGNLNLLPDQTQKKMVVNTIQNMMAARISDYYNLLGPSYIVDTACSSALVACHQACQSIRSGEVDMAVAGGIELLVDQFPHIGFSQSGALSDEPVSYVFDERAKGFVLGEGAGVVLLKSYDAAVRDGDNILAVILGSAVNNDGHTMGLTVPNLEGQKKVIEKALNNANISPETISYLEAHGTGTLLGDPIEVKAASQVYRNFTDRKQFCAIGSVKTNIGHLLRAAGMASIIKVILSLQNKIIPATLHCSKPHPRFKFDSSPFYPITKTMKWQSSHIERRAGISSFGFGGTNCHMILEEFNNSKVTKYNKVRMSLPLTIFNRKSYWLGEDNYNPEEVDNDLLLNLIDSLQNGFINESQALELMKLSEYR